MPRRYAIALVLSLLAPAVAEPEPEQDVVVLKDGARLRGFVVEETDTSIVLRILVKGAKGETALTGTQRIDREDIAEIRRAAPEARERAEAKAEAFESRERRQRERRARIRVGSVAIGEWPAVRAAGDLFEVRTTCDEEFALDACDALQQAYEGYLRHFKLRRPERGRLPVILLSGRQQYDEYVTRTYGQTIQNPAFYNHRDNVIVAYNFIEKEEEARVRAHIREQQGKIEAQRKTVAGRKKEIDEEETAARKHVYDEAARARNEIRRVDPANRPALLRDVDAWQAEQLDGIRRKKKEIDEAFADYGKKAHAAIRECQRAIRHNQRVLRDQNREMFETLFHECFHAFAKNRLYRDREIPRWLNEGMACHFEMSVMEGGELVHGAPNRGLRKVYREAAKEDRLPLLASVLGAGGGTFVVLHQGQADRSNRAYAVSWALAHYLVASKTTKEQMDAYVSAVDAGQDPGAALEKMLGRPLHEIDRAVRAHVASMK